MKGMKRKSHFSRAGGFAAAAALSAVLIHIAGCSRMEMQQHENKVTLSFVTEISTKSRDPQETLLTDINVFIFNEAGQMEKNLYLKKNELSASGEGYGYEVSLLKNCRYSIYVCANTGYSLPIRNMKNLMDYEYHFVYEDEYAIGVPMSGCKENIMITGQKQVEISLKRTMAKISVCIDRSRLYNDVKFYVRSIRIGGCPSKVRLFGESRITDKDDAFTVGFIKSGFDAEVLNTTDHNGKSKETSLYMFENLHGNQLYGAASYKEKYFGQDDPRAEYCSYIELKIDYLSASHYTKPGKSLIYRFYLGDDACNFDVRRNTHYHITVMPEGDGLQGDGWRVDKTAIISS